MAMVDHKVETKSQKRSLLVVKNKKMIFSWAKKNQA